MKTVGIFDAKTKFSELVEQVSSSGQSITVTNRGKPVVDITPTRATEGCGMTREEAFLEIARLRAELPEVSKEEIREMINEGRS